MAMNLKKRIPSKQLKAAIELNYQRAAFLYNDKEKVNQVLNSLDEYIQRNTTITDTFDDLKKHMEIIRDATTGKCKELTPECIVSILSALLSLEDSYQQDASIAEPALDRKPLLAYVEKSFKTDMKEYALWEKWSKPGIYPMIPMYIVDQKEEDSLELLSKRYEKLLEPTLPSKASKKLLNLIPENVQNQLTKVADSITEQEFYTQVMKAIADGFDLMVKHTAKVSLSEDYILKQLNKTFDDNHIFSLNQVCYARGYDISKQVNRFKTQNVFTAFAEGGITGLGGLARIPTNLAASMFLYYRAIQSVALYYGYDVKNDPDELQIATDVFMQALSPATGSTSEMGEMITKFMAMTEALVIKDTLKGGWKAMAERGGIFLLITQIRSLAHKSAEKALQEAGKKSLEKTMFTSFFEQLGKKMTQETVKKAVTPIAALITAFTDMNTMNNVIEFADIFYNKRFITEKQTRIGINEGPETIEDVDFEVITE